jgi:glycosyltransferase involved in cell wall biosynthesis
VTAPSAASPRVSVVLTTCNSERFLEGQLSSILQQTRPVDEIVVGDDASTDATRSILKEFLSAAPMETHVIARHVSSRLPGQHRVDSTASDR